MEREGLKKFKILFQEYQDYYSFLNLKFDNIYTKIIELSKDDLSYDNLKTNALKFFNYALEKRFREEPLKYLILLFKKHFHKEDVNKSFDICNTILNSIDFSLNMDLCNVLLDGIPDLKDSLVNAPNNNLTTILKNTILNSKPLVIDSKNELDSADDNPDWEYMREIKKIPLLNRDEEYKLAKEKSEGSKLA